MKGRIGGDQMLDACGKSRRLVPSFARKSLAAAAIYVETLGTGCRFPGPGNVEEPNAETACPASLPDRRSRRACGGKN